MATDGLRLEVTVRAERQPGDHQERIVRVTTTDSDATVRLAVATAFDPPLPASQVFGLREQPSGVAVGGSGATLDSGGVYEVVYLPVIVSVAEDELQACSLLWAARHGGGCDGETTTPSGRSMGSERMDNPAHLPPRTANTNPLFDDNSDEEGTTEGILEKLLARRREAGGESRACDGDEIEVSQPALARGASPIAPADCEGTGPSDAEQAGDTDRSAAITKARGGRAGSLLHGVYTGVGSMVSSLTQLVHPSSAAKPVPDPGAEVTPAESSATDGVGGVESSGASQQALHEHERGSPRKAVPNSVGPNRSARRFRRGLRQSGFTADDIGSMQAVRDAESYRRERQSLSVEAGWAYQRGGNATPMVTSLAATPQPDGFMSILEEGIAVVVDSATTETRPRREAMESLIKATRGGGADVDATPLPTARPSRANTKELGEIASRLKAAATFTPPVEEDHGAT